MKNTFAISLAIIGAAIGFILGTTIAFSLNINSPVAVYGLGAILAVAIGIGLVRVAPFIDTQEKSIQQALTILCAIIAFIFILFLMVSFTMLNTYFISK